MIDPVLMSLVFPLKVSKKLLASIFRLEQVIPCGELYVVGGRVDGNSVLKMEAGRTHD
jgi:hypothetical protein